MLNAQCVFQLIQMLDLANSQSVYTCKEDKLQEELNIIFIPDRPFLLFFVLNLHVR